MPPSVGMSIKRSSQLGRLDQRLDIVQRSPGSRSLGQIDHGLPRGMHHTCRSQLSDARLIGP